MRALKTIIESWGSEIADHYEWHKESLHFLNDMRTVARRASWASALKLFNRAILDKASLCKRKGHNSSKAIKQTHLKEVLKISKDMRRIERAKNFGSTGTEIHARLDSKITDPGGVHSVQHLVEVGDVQRRIEVTNQIFAGDDNFASLAYDQYGILIAATKPKEDIRVEFLNEAEVSNNQRLLLTHTQWSIGKAVSGSCSPEDCHVSPTSKANDQLGVNSSTQQLDDSIRLRNFLEDDTDASPVANRKLHDADQQNDPQIHDGRAPMIDFDELDHAVSACKLCCVCCQRRLALIEKEVAALRSVARSYQQRSDLVSF
jgi:hypothetical protein